jgi:Nucleotidyl transferase AbiEii toxin, Type IV TA system
MSPEDFTDLGTLIASDLSKYGLEVEVKMAFQWAFHCYVRIPRVLYDYGLSGYEEEKILIQLDTVPQPIAYESSPFILGGFGFRDTISITPKEILLAQKITAAYSRKRTQGRDFYDIEFLRSWGVKPSFDYLWAVFDLWDELSLAHFMQEKNKSIDFDTLARDVEPFLFRSRDVEWVRNFGEKTEQRDDLHQI